MKPLNVLLHACVLCTPLIPLAAKAQNDLSRIQVKTWPAGGQVSMMEAVEGFGGGNVAVSVGPDGVLIVDNMFVPVMPKLQAAIRVLSDKPVRYVVNTHFHGDHIAGNTVLGPSATIIAHENLRKRLEANPRTEKPMLPSLVITDKASLFFNGEEVRLTHLPSGHTDTDIVVYFTSSKVAHLGDMYFAGMFPAVYTQGGGNIRQLIVNLEKVVADIAADAKVVPGHGPLSTVDDLKNYITMLKETTSIVSDGIKKGITLEQLTRDKALAKYDALGSGGAQTTDQYLAMLYRLLSQS
jgi:cyclase